MCNVNFSVLNERKNKDRFYPLESEVYNLCEHQKNTCGVVIFDSCREAITAEQMHAGNEESIAEAEKDKEL